MLPHPPGHMSVIEEFGGGERVKSLFLLSENRLLTRGLPMDHGSGVYGSVGGKPEEEEEEEELHILEDDIAQEQNITVLRTTLSQRS